MRPDILHTVALAIAAILGLGGCASSGGAAGDPVPVERAGPSEPVPYDEAVLKDKRSAGFMLAEMDRKLRAWNNLVLNGRTDKDPTRIDLLESALQHEARTKFAVLTEQLATGPQINRQIAAAGLGWSNTPEALGPLLGALGDRNEDVVANALLGLSTLGDPTTPLANIATMLADPVRSPAVRSNAGRVLRTMDLSSRNEAEQNDVREAARDVLGDETEALRVHGALLLAQLVDTESIDRLAAHLEDPVPLVARASSRAIARIGSISKPHEGQAVRALVQGLSRADRKAVRPFLERDLQKLAKRNYDSEEEWLEYAYGLP